MKNEVPEANFDLTLCTMYMLRNCACVSGCALLSTKVGNIYTVAAVRNVIDLAKVVTERLAGQL